MEQDYDLIVVGGGPGGSTLATLVAMQNRRVLLLEREQFPRYQIGESLLPATVHGICVILGVAEQIKAANFVRKNGGSFRWGKNPQPWTFGFGLSPLIGESSGYAYQVERAKFDNILLNNARHKGVDVRERQTVDKVLTEAGRVVGVEYLNENGKRCAARAYFVADASGHQSMIAKTVGERLFSKFFQNVALFAYYENGKRLSPPNQGNILCASFEHGWFWYIPLSDTLTSVGAVIAREHADRLKGDHETAMRQFIASCPLISEYLAHARRVIDGMYGKIRVRKDYSYCNTRFWAPGIVLVGDAACFIDPVFSSGVHLATYSALLAARSINTALRGEIREERCFDEFERRYRREFGNFYQFLLAFYDTNLDEDSYFWEARKILNTEERANEAFVRLVAGVSTSGEALYSGSGQFFDKHQEQLSGIFDSKDQMYLNTTPGTSQNQPKAQNFVQGLLSEITQVQSLANLGPRRISESPMFEDGLIPSADGLRWVEPAIQMAPA